MPETESRPAPHLPSYFRLMLFELTKQAEWGANVGRQIVTGEGNVWTHLHLFAVHAGTVGAFAQTFKSRRAELRRLFPDRAEAIREVTRTTYDFSGVIEFRHAMSHLDERIEYGWSQLANANSTSPDLLVRAEGRIDDGRERLLNWLPARNVASFRSRDGSEWIDVDIAEVSAELEEIQRLSAHEFMTRTLGPDWVNVVQGIVSSAPTLRGQNGKAAGDGVEG
jgi:hypothetical protein